MTVGHELVAKRHGCQTRPENSVVMMNDGRIKLAQDSPQTRNAA